MGTVLLALAIMTLALVLLFERDIRKYLKGRRPKRTPRKTRKELAAAHRAAMARRWQATRETYALERVWHRKAQEPDRTGFIKKERRGYEEASA